MKQVKNLLKRIGHIYIEGFVQMYKPVIEHGINPFI